MEELNKTRMSESHQGGTCERETWETKLSKIQADIRRIAKRLGVKMDDIWKK